MLKPVWMMLIVEASPSALEKMPVASQKVLERQRAHRRVQPAQHAQRHQRQGVLAQLAHGVPVGQAGEGKVEAAALQNQKDHRKDRHQHRQGHNGIAARGAAEAHRQVGNLGQQRVHHALDGVRAARSVPSGSTATGNGKQPASSCRGTGTGKWKNPAAPRFPRSKSARSPAAPPRTPPRSPAPPTGRRSKARGGSYGRGFRGRSGRMPGPAPDSTPSKRGRCRCRTCSPAPAPRARKAVWRWAWR